MTVAAPITYAELKTGSTGYWCLLAALASLTLLGVAAAHHMDVSGHQVTGMSNQIVWGLPHVFAIFLIVAASGALNLASLVSVFGKLDYQPLARYSAILALALLLGGLAILLLDLGRPDRLIVALTHYNFKSIFAWNIILYGGFIVIVGIYLWMLIEPGRQAYRKPVGLLAFIWRLTLTSGTGLIFGFLVAREAFDSALLAPMFVVMSFAFGLAIFIPLLMLSFRLDQRELDASHLRRLRNLLRLFIASVCYFVLIFHLSKLYGTHNHGFERFLLVDGGIYPWLFWGGQIGLGYLLPLALLFAPGYADSATSLVAACLSIIAGAFAQLYTLIIGGQAYPLNIFPGYQVSSSFYDGVVNDYVPSLVETLLGIGGLAAALLIALLAMRVLPIVPTALSRPTP